MCLTSFLLLIASMNFWLGVFGDILLFFFLSLLLLVSRDMEIYERVGIL